MMPVATGLALAAQLRGEKRVAATFTGDGATSEGDFHEALNLAAVWKLPVLFVIENNQWGLSTPTAEQFACKSLADRALGYGMPGTIVDGNDVIAVYRAVTRAAERARRGDGPTLLEFKTFRMRGHEEASGTDYVPKEMLEQWAQKDPLARLEKLLLDKNVLSPADRDATRAAYKARIDVLVDEALGAKDPEGGADGAARGRLRAEPPEGEGAREGRPGGRAALRGRDQRRPAGGHAPQRQGRAAGPGHRGVRGRLQGHGRVRGRVRQGARSQHAHHRIGGARLRAGPGPGRLRAPGRDAVRRLHHLRVQPDREQPGQDPLPLGRARSGGGARPRGRRHRRGTVSLAEPRELVHERGRPQGGGPRDAPRRQGPAHSPPSRTATPSSTSSTSSCIARRRARCPPATTRCPWARPGWPARERRRRS